MVTDFSDVLASLAGARQKYDEARKELESMKRRREDIAARSAVLPELDARIGQAEVDLAEMLNAANRMGITIDRGVIIS
ncbi:hypothetical protein [uncultured Thiodictyon sp.]|uniref:hypothetical protein n=1 Tax=uncultured Thiodictyon sp. TaxID=1846217 RepID=UPI0025D21406|nr:hypothetical protein [uncultured Thiodictyon sp.]